MEILLAVDRTISFFVVEQLRHEWMNPLMVAISFIGNAGMIWFLFAFVMLCMRKYRRGGAAVICALAIGFLLGNILLKNVVMRPRPCWEFSEVEMLVPVPQDYSFPSGHTLAAFATASVIFCINRKVGIVVFLLAAAMGFSRIYLFVHYASDVLAGALIGCAIGFMTVYLFYKAGNWPFHEKIKTG